MRIGSRMMGSHAICSFRFEIDKRKRCAIVNGGTIVAFPLERVFVNISIHLNQHNVALEIHSSLSSHFLRFKCKIFLYMM